MQQMFLGWNADWPLPKKCGNPSNNKFIAELPNFVNKEIDDFRCSIVVMSDSFKDLRIFNTQNRESVQATSQRMERVQNQVTSIRSDLKEQIE